MKFHRKISFPLLLLLVFCFCSCESTREYVKSQRTLYENDIAVSEEYKSTKDGKIIESKSKRFYDLADVCSFVEEDDSKIEMKAFTAYREQSLKSSDEELVFSLMLYKSIKATNETESYVLGSKTVKISGGKLSSSVDASGTTIKARGDYFGEEMEKVFNEYLDEMVNFVLAQNDSDGADEEASAEIVTDKKTQEVSSSERVRVESRPNGKYIFYQAAGKPFVIVGVTAWNLVKCAGYAFINFMGGYNLATGNGGTLWKLPSYSAARDKAAVAREANKIQHYPEYHIPFTDNHIIVDKFDRDISVIALADEGKEEIIPIEHSEYGTTLSVSRSASADAASTAAVAGLIGTVVTIPVSVVTWVGGAALGIYSEVAGNK